MILNLFPFILAGLLNGSFVIPMRFIGNLTNEKIWMLHAIIGMAILPWVMLLTIQPNVLPNYLNLTRENFFWLFISGSIFGLGQICFAYAIKKIGIGLSFAINLSVGIIIGSLFVLLDKAILFTKSGMFVFLALSLIITSLIMNYYVSKVITTNSINYRDYFKGWLLALFTGLTSGLQNITFTIFAFHINNTFEPGNTFWIWPPFLLAATLPMVIGFYKINQFHKLERDKKYSLIYYLKNFILIFIMGLFFTGSLALYSRGMNNLNPSQQFIGWPLFMIIIILTSQFWGFFDKNSNNKLGKILIKIGSITLLLIAILILGYKT